MAGLRLVRALSVAVVALTATPRAAEPPQTTASAVTAGDVRRLYEAADYEGALRAAAGLDDAALAPAAAREVRVYETLCLLAVGRQDEADRQIERMLRRDPAFVPGDDLPNRLRTAVGAVRNRLAAELATAPLAEGRALYAAGKPAAALAQFDTVLAVADLVTPDALPHRDDIRTLAAGFKALATRAAAALSSGPVARATSPVVEPKPVTQQLPPWPESRTAARTGGRPAPDRSGVLEVVITNAGTVKSARLVEAIDPVYDQVLLDAAKNWQYLPATRGDLPIEYVKRLTIRVK